MTTYSTGKQRLCLINKPLIEDRIHFFLPEPAHLTKKKSHKGKYLKLCVCLVHVLMTLGQEETMLQFI